MENSSATFGLNDSYVAYLRAQWETDPHSVAEEWQHIFSTEPAAKKLPFANVVAANDKTTTIPINSNAQPLVGLALKIAENMEASLHVPTATSAREVGVKILEENRHIVNDYLESRFLSKCSFTHFIAYAIVQAVRQHSAMNNNYALQAGKAHKVLNSDINIGVAVDVAGRDGARMLVVPNIKACQDFNFKQFIDAYNALIERARQNKLKPDEFVGTTVTLTNTGAMGTLLSIPRLMVNQGTIVAAGRIGIPAHFEGTHPEVLEKLGVGKVMMLTSTYDHRVIQGADSGRFLAYVAELLAGEHAFYDKIFDDLHIAVSPYVLSQEYAQNKGGEAQGDVKRALGVSHLIRAFREKGHLIADVNPLQHPAKNNALDLLTHDLSVWDLDRECDAEGSITSNKASLRKVIDALRNAYCKKISFEFMHLHSAEQRLWMQRRAENDAWTINVNKKKEILAKLLQAENFESFLHKRYLGQKRFGIEGADTVIAMLHHVLDRAAFAGVEEVMVGMAHRGRLNVMANIMGISYVDMLAKFEGIFPFHEHQTGDVKYHLGAEGQHWCNVDGNKRAVKISLACNPSHLEAVNPVVEGMVRALQDNLGAEAQKKIVPILLHGDAAFAGQGVVYETMQFAGLVGYSTGGTIHIVLNNQIGYTTPPEKARTSLYCTDVAKAVGAPVIRVNGDAPEQAVRAVEIALDYRQKFGGDVVIDMLCYRRHGHNEGDDPSFTQPVMYDIIKNHPTVATLYGDRLVAQKEMSDEERKAMQTACFNELDAAYNTLHEMLKKGQPVNKAREQKDERKKDENFSTAVTIERLQEIAEKTSTIPENITINPRVYTQVVQRRYGMVFNEQPAIDFGMAEILAYGTILQDGISVRMSGQDCGRGTFVHRHAILYDVPTGKPYIPLNYLNQADKEHANAVRLSIVDSSLSEEGVVGFEYGYSVAHEKALVIWEAQFGDFFNGAQIQIDQFMSSAESKWGQKSNLVLFLPHGYDGQGPEHSSARIERFLQLCAKNNMRIANVTSPAQFFHLLRWQAQAPKKPLVVFTHKSILRAEDAGSHLHEFTSGNFNRVLLDVHTPSAKQLVFCSGKLYWELHRYRLKNPDVTKHVSLIRIEQLYPFPHEEIKKSLKQAGAKEAVWIQEEPQNNGAYRFIKPYFDELQIKLHYVGRAESASPAVGMHKKHDEEQQKIISHCFAEKIVKDFLV